MTGSEKLSTELAKIVRIQTEEINRYTKNYIRKMNELDEANLTKVANVNLCLVSVTAVLDSFCKILLDMGKEIEIKKISSNRLLINGKLLFQNMDGEWVCPAQNLTPAETKAAFDFINSGK